jgi:hypothetical protein
MFSQVKHLRFRLILQVDHRLRTVVFVTQIEHTLHHQFQVEQTHNDGDHAAEEAKVRLVEVLVSLLSLSFFPTSHLEADWRME